MVFLSFLCILNRLFTIIKVQRFENSVLYSMGSNLSMQNVSIISTGHVNHTVLCLVTDSAHIP